MCKLITCGQTDSDSARSNYIGAFYRLRLDVMVLEELSSDLPHEQRYER